MTIGPNDMLVALQPWINKQIRTAWHPQVRLDDPAPSISSFSGIPLLQQGEDWPTCKCCDAPTELILQLDLASLPINRHGHGILQLFYCVTGDLCDRGWEPFANHTSQCRVIQTQECRAASTNLNRFPAKTIEGWAAFADQPDSAEHERLGIKIDYHFRDVPFQPMELWCPELDLHFVGAEFINSLEESVNATDGDKLGGWPSWVQGVEYPRCPECGSEMQLVFQIDSEDNVPYMFGDCGIGHITQCPRHHQVVAFGWSCS